MFHKSSLLQRPWSKTKTHTLLRAFQGHWPITEVDLHSDHVLVHFFAVDVLSAETKS